MKKRMTDRQGWLVEAAARTTTAARMMATAFAAAVLMMVLAACTNEDNAIDEPTAGAGTTIHVTVGAGIGEGDAAAAEGTTAGETTTRADVTVWQDTQEAGSKTRTLIFTEGDCLYIWGYKTVGEVRYNLAGYLDIDQTSIGSDGTTAQFSGDLKTYDNEGQEVTYAFTTDDPLTEFSCWAYLVPKDAVEGLYQFEKDIFPNFNYAKSIVSTTSSSTDVVNELMKKALYVVGNYNATTRSFSLEKQDPILNFNISGLEKSETYNVRLVASTTETNFKKGNYDGCDLTFDQTVESSSKGDVRFAISVENASLLFRGIYLSNSSGRCFIPLGVKELEKKVYNVKRKLPYSQQGTLEGIQNQFGFNEETVGSQSDYGLLKMQINLVDVPSTERISEVHLRMSNELYILTANNWPFSWFTSGDILYAAIKDDTHADVIVTAYAGTSNRTPYRGAAYLHILGSKTSDLGTLTLRSGIVVNNYLNYEYVEPDPGTSGNYSLGSDCYHIVYGKGNANIEAQGGYIYFAAGTELTGNLNFGPTGSINTDLYLKGDVTVIGDLTGNGISGHETRLWKGDKYVSNVTLTVNGHLYGRIMMYKGVTVRTTRRVDTSDDYLGIFDSSGNRITPVSINVGSHHYYEYVGN